jgi:hypothetical protein
LYVLTWKERVTPAGRSISALLASARRTPDKGCTGWPTPAARDWKSEKASDEFNQQRWEHTRGKPLSARKGSPQDLQQAATLAGWPTPLANDAKGSAYSYSQGDHSRPALKLLGAARLAGWPTPMAGTLAQNGNNPAGNTDSSRKTVELVKGSPARLTVSGELRTGFCAGLSPDFLTDAGAPLNPEHSRWLMGLPVVWTKCTPTATRSTRRSRARTSKP